MQLIGTPIGNLGDITFRAVEAIRAAHAVACEDTRHSQRLLAHLGISGKELVALHEHNEQQRAPALVERALRGERIVFLSDAGTPTISDPGYRLVNACHDAGVRVEVLPGPSAVITALAGSEFISGLPDVLRIPLSEPLFILGTLFILVVLFLPGGIAGLAKRASRRSTTREERATLEEAGS